MTRKMVLPVLLLIGKVATAQPPFEMSRNIYRVPYGNNIDVRISRDHYNHTPAGRYDMGGRNNGSSCSINYPIVAAASGFVRRIQDAFDVHGPDCTENCSDFNNFVWIEHANGEWTKYSHIRRNSATVTAGLSVGNFVSVGQLLGYECDIGQASGPHLHFEVRAPNNPSNVQITASGGFMSDAAHRIPVICGQNKNYWEAGNEMVSGACGACNLGVALFMSNQAFLVNSVYARLMGGAITTGSNLNFMTASSTMLQSSTLINFGPGLLVSEGAYFSAKIGACTTTPY